jgi:hypothetical protein
MNFQPNLSCSNAAEAAYCWLIYKGLGLQQPMSSSRKGVEAGAAAEVGRAGKAGFEQGVRGNGGCRWQPAYCLLRE